MLPDIPRDWMGAVRNVFLIRHPARVIASFGAKYDAMTLTDIGFAQQSELFDHVTALGQTPIVIDSADIRCDSQGMPRALCDALGLDWDDAMLNWLAGGHTADGVWAPVWYDAVHRSTGFAGPEGPLPDLTPTQAEFCDQGLPHHQRLERMKLRA